jgi:hypothetical protein
VHDSVYDIAGDDPRIAMLLRRSLTKLAAGPDGPLKEMAEGILDGHLDLRHAAMSDTYGDQLGAAFGRFWSHYQDLDPADRDQLVARTQRQLDELLDGPVPPR